MEPKSGSVTPLASPPRGIILAGGPSLTSEQIDHVRHSGERFFIIAVNRSFEICNFIDVIYAADFDFLTEFRDQFPSGVPVYSTWNSESGDPGWQPFEDVTYLRGIDPPFFSFHPDRLTLGSNSGFQAINLAMHFGIKEILLLGYDFREINGQKHWFGDYKQPRLNRSGDWHFWKRRMHQAAPSAEGRGVKIINCSPQSALTCFEKMDITDAIKTGNHYRDRL